MNKEGNPLSLQPTANGAEALTISQLNKAIAQTLSDAFDGSFWIVGELQGFDRSAEAAKSKKWGQIYFELVEKEEGQDQIVAKVKAMMWGNAYDKIVERLKEADEKLILQDGLEVRLLCRLDYYWKWGELRVVVSDVDPDFTLGKMERAKRELIKKLKTSGQFDRNRQTQLAAVPQTIGLITANESAAYHDFIEELKQSGYYFRVYFYPAAMQGESTESYVAAGLKSLAANHEIDAIAISRGGGSRSDLVWFDKESIALAIAECPKPVLTGIGHEIDESVADLVSYQTFKTPTKIAAFLVQRVSAFETGINQAAGAISTLAITRLRKDFDVIEAYPGKISKAVTAWFEREYERLAAMADKCRLLDPKRLMLRGYSLVRNQAGKLIKKAREIKPGENFSAHFSDGVILANRLKE